MGIVSGFVLKLARQSTNTTQEGLAEALGVDASTVQGWESGRRPLTALRTSDLARLRMLLTRYGAPAAFSRHLSDALEADLILATGVDIGHAWGEHILHPLSMSVHRRSVVNLVTWPITGRAPVELGRFISRRGRRGPVVSCPNLNPDERTRLFDHFHAIAERARGTNFALMRRQAIYLLGFDNRSEIAAWLQQEWRRTISHPREGLHGLLDTRSAAVARASLGEDGVLQDFVSTLRSDRAEDANLNYWAHWIGELSDEQHDDNFMIDTDPQSWAGLRLAEHLVTRIAADSPHLPLNLHTLHALVGTRLPLFTAWPRLREKLENALELLHSVDGFDRGTRDKLIGLTYAVRSANR